MSAIQEPFKIAYCGVTIEVAPVVNGLDMQYIVSLPTRTVIIETALNEKEFDYWQEIGAGRTKLAEEIGAIIERREL
ncbi:hypothetical protein [Segetibacter koreensis]|uniref:hypothetical protein n=1 Tax=Segetibacter koreensis TaxID=398037 RepID=UPI0003614BA5|nr:hypothetical protein [Segetibacter koreensis]